MDKQGLIDNILRLRAVEKELGLTPNLLAVMEDLQHRVGATVKPAMAARFLGVSQPALTRWRTSGDIPTVLTPNERHEVSLSQLLTLIEEVRSIRDEGHARPLSEVLRRRRDRAEALRPTLQRKLSRANRDQADGHRRAELRSLALHWLVADRLDESVILRAQRRLDEFEREGKINTRYAKRWREVLSLPPEKIRRILTSDTQEARDLRQNTPLPVVVTEPERRLVRELIAA